MKKLTKKEMRRKAMSCPIRVAEPHGPMIGCEDCDVFNYCTAITITQRALKLRP